MQQATREWNQTGRAARIFTELDYKTRKRKKGGWKRERRVVAKAEHIDGKENPRFVATSLSQQACAGRALYLDGDPGLRRPIIANRTRAYTQIGRRR